MRVSTPLRALASAGALALVLSGCATGTGNKNGPTSTSTFSSGTSVSGKLSVMGFGASDEVAKTRLEYAKSQLSGVDVSLVEGKLDIQQFLSAVASGKPPELIYASRDQLGTFASRGAIVPLDDCISGEQIPLSDYRKPAVSQSTFAGKVYGVPEFNQVEITMANSKLLSAAGLSLGDVDGSDWSKVTDASKKLTKNDGGKLSVIGFDSKLPEFLPIWAHSNGASPVSDDGRKAQLDSPKMVEALEFAANIYKDEGGFSAVKSFRDSADFFGKGNQFASNSLGAMPMEQWYVNILSDVSPSAPVDFTTIKTKDGSPTSYATGSAWAIPANSANPQAACRFIRNMTSTDAWMKAAQARNDKQQKAGHPFTGLFTGNASADAKIKDTYVKITNDNWGNAIKASYEANENSFALPALPAGAEFTAAWQEAVNKVLAGQQTPSEALKQAQTVAQKALDDAWAKWDSRK